MKNNFYSIVGILVFIIPFLGIPVSWRDAILSLLGFTIFIFSIRSSIMRRLTTKPKNLTDINNDISKSE